MIVAARQFTKRGSDALAKKLWIQIADYNEQQTRSLHHLLVVTAEVLGGQSRDRLGSAVWVVEVRMAGIGETCLQNLQVRIGRVGVVTDGKDDPIAHSLYVFRREGGSERYVGEDFPGVIEIAARRRQRES